MNNTPANPSLDDIRVELNEIEQAIADQTYVPGRWQRLLRSLHQLEKSTLDQLAGEISKVSDALHGRNGFLSLGFWPVFIAELAALTLAISLSSSESLILRIISTGLFALTLQPLLKIAAGLTLGVRYSYAYLWYFEPRFKMQYGTYITRATWQRMILHLIGSVGTVLAMYIGMQLLADNTIFYTLCLLGFVGALAMQAGAFIAALAGVKKVGPFVLHQLTTPAMLGFEVRQLLAR